MRTTGRGGTRRSGPLRAAANDRERVPDQDKNSHYYSESAAGPPELDTLLDVYLAKTRANAAADAARSALEHDDPSTSSSPSSPSAAPNTGKVYLIGTGPGDPGLLTLKAYHLMQTADVVLYDRLVSPQILNLVSKDSTMLYVGKQSGYHTRTQDEIEAMMLAFAANGATIVRLKGGDPLVFGRGGEEMEALAANGHEVRIVPGITAAAGVGSELGIPLTHRGVATSVRLLTGHLREGAAAEASDGKGNGVGDAVDFAVTSADLDTTLVVYMGLGTLPRLAQKLVDSGFPMDTPAVAVERGTTVRERRVFSTIADPSRERGDVRVEVADAAHRRRDGAAVAVVAVERRSRRRRLTPRGFKHSCVRSARRSAVRGHERVVRGELGKPAEAPGDGSRDEGRTRRGGRPLPGAMTTKGRRKYF
jgi:uroporphyrin-III C-methyltransferase